jgi:hypothetical protein
MAAMECLKVPPTYGTWAMLAAAAAAHG